MTHSKTIGELAVANGGRPGRLLAVFSTRVLSFLIQLYRWTLSPALAFLFGANSGCRFIPTCSQYAREAIQRHGAMAGGLLALKRVCCCNPFGSCGHDPVPEARENLARPHPSSLHFDAASPSPLPQERGKPSLDFHDWNVFQLSAGSGIFYQKRRHGRRTPRHERSVDEVRDQEARENEPFNQSLVTSAPTHIEPALIMNRHRIYGQNVLPHPGPLPLGEGEWSADGLKRQTTELVQGFNALPKMGGKGFHG